MRILLVHNFYRHPGGEDTVFYAERELLSQHGHCVIQFEADNCAISSESPLYSAQLALGTIWSHRSFRRLRQVIDDERPDLAHFHNTFPLISPAAYYACKQRNVPVIQTLHNYRLLCPGGTFFRGGTVCEDCHRQNLFSSVYHGCYRDSRTATTVTAAMLATHRLLGTWSGTVDKYITLSAFARDKFAEAGLPAAKLTVKANFVEVDPGVGEHDGGYVLFAGRLVEGKGVGLLMKAWSKIPDIPLRIAGDGPLQSQVNSTLGNGSGQLTFLGWASRERIIDLLKGAALLVFPSECYEGFPMLIAEAYACGTPVIASRLGAMREIVTDGKTGLHFTPGDSGDLAAKIQWAWEHADARAQMGINARAEYEAKYTAEENYQMLTAIYRQVLA